MAKQGTAPIEHDYMTPFILIISNQKTPNCPTFQPPEETGKSKDGWEYSKAFTTRFHSKKKGFDMVRRRRWHRKLVREDPNAPEPVFSLVLGKVKIHVGSSNTNK